MNILDKYKMLQVKNIKPLEERIDKPEGDIHTPDHITDDSTDGLGRKKKQMGNRTPLDIIAKILAGR